MSGTSPTPQTDTGVTAGRDRHNNKQQQKMFLEPHHFNYRFKEQAEAIAECEELLRTGEISQEEADYLCDLDRFFPFMEKSDSLCFACGKKLTIPCIYWHGSDGEKNGEAKEIFLHIECSKHFINGLQMDVKKAERFNGEAIK